MMNKLRLGTYWRVFWQLRKIRLAWSLEYRADFMFWTFISLMWTTFNFFFISILMNVSGTVAGWTTTEMYVLMASYTIIDALTWSLFYHNMSAYTRSIFNGNLNQHLVRPLNTQFLLMTYDNSFTSAIRLLVGIVMLIWSVSHLEYSVSLFQVLSYILLMITSSLLMYFFWFIISTFAFYVERMDNINELVPSMRRIYQMPRPIYTGIVSLVLTTLLPFALITSIPSEALLGKLTLRWLLQFLTITVLVIYGSHRFFKFSLRRYVGQAN